MNALMCVHYIAGWSINCVHIGGCSVCVTSCGHEWIQFIV